MSSARIEKPESWKIRVIYQWTEEKGKMPRRHHDLPGWKEKIDKSHKISESNAKYSALKIAADLMELEPNAEETMRFERNTNAYKIFNKEGEQIMSVHFAKEGGTSS